MSSVIIDALSGELLDFPCPDSNIYCPQPNNSSNDNFK